MGSVSRIGPAAEADIMPSGPRRREQRPTGLAGLGELRGSETKVAVSPGSEGVGEMTGGGEWLTFWPSPGEMVSTVTLLGEE